jgi:hypothetical protein
MGRLVFAPLLMLILSLTSLTVGAEEPASPVTRDLAEAIGTLKEGQRGMQQQIQGVRQELSARIDETNGWLRGFTGYAPTLLGGMVAIVLAVIGGVATVWHKIGQLENALSGVQKTLEKDMARTESTLTTIDERVRGVEQKLGGVESRLAGVESTFAGFPSSIRVFQESVDTFRAEVRQLSVLSSRDVPPQVRVRDPQERSPRDPQERSPRESS